MIEVTKVSPLTGAEHTVKVDISQKDYDAWRRGELPHIQHAFPHLTDDEREFLISGVTAEEWDQFMGEPQE